MISVKFSPSGVHIDVDGEQHISRLTQCEVRKLVIQLLVFGGPDLRKDIMGWLNGGKLDELGRFLTHEATDPAPEPAQEVKK